MLPPIHRSAIAAATEQDPLALTRRAWYLGIRERSLLSTMAVSHNRLLLERLQHERQELGRQREALRGAAEALATRLGPGHWEVALLQEVIRRSARRRLSQAD